MNRKTPIMGWASWNCFRTNINEEKIKAQADALIKCGLPEYGYTYFNMDDGFFGGRNSEGKLNFCKERFPNGIKVIADYAHALGLNAGIYAEGGDKTCGYYYDNEGQRGDNVGLYGFEEQDLNLFLRDYGFDFIKVDWCGGVRLGISEQEQYTKIANIIDKIRNETGRCIVYNICRWQFPGAWATKIADSWRTGADIAPNFSSVLHQLDVIKPLARYCCPGHVNDLDMMQIGNGMPLEDEKTHFAMWCMMSTPLMIGCDLTKINEDTLNILKNRELIAINQDSACLQAFPVKEILDDSGSISGEIWVKDLGKKNSNIKAVAFLNRSNSPITLSASLNELGLSGKVLSVSDITNNIDACEDCISGVSLVPHQVIVYKIEAENSFEIENKEDKGEFIFKPIEKISLETALDMQKNGAYIADVREWDEFEKSHLDGAVNVPYFDIHGIAKELLPDKNRKVIVYCKTGKRSEQSHNSLHYLGYDVYYLGGIEI